MNAAAFCLKLVITFGLTLATDASRTFLMRFAMSSFLPSGILGKSSTSAIIVRVQKA